MSTRGSVAWRIGNKVVGIYNHCDSYPTGLGLDVSQKAAELGIGGLINALSNCGDWRELETNGVCEYCGKVAGQPHSIGSGMYLANVAGQQYPDPEAKFHSHGDGKDDQFNPFRDPLFMEWVYVLDHTNDVIEVWKSVSNHDVTQDVESAKRSKWVKLDHSLNTSYCHFLVETLKPGADQFDMEGLENKARKMVGNEE